MMDMFLLSARCCQLNRWPLQCVPPSPNICQLQSLIQSTVQDLSQQSASTSISQSKSVKLYRSLEPHGCTRVFHSWPPVLASQLKARRVICVVRELAHV